VFGVSLRLAPGKSTALFGHNGAGKTSVMKAAAGINPTFKGRVELFGNDVTGARADRRVQQGLVYLPQDLAVFPTLTVRDNLMVGATTVRDRGLVERRTEEVCELFPILADRQGSSLAR
jgi:ABC-type branched-subunit amino acid transport system ATPase component